MVDTATPAGLGSVAARPTRHDLPALDAIRGLAAAAVLATHVGFATGATAEGAFGAILARLDYGVAIFFALSGFLLFRPWWEAATGTGGSVSVRRYAIHRVLRIMPLYWVVLGVVILAIPANRAAGWDTIVANATLLQIYPPDALLDGYTQTWSLATEVSFYAVLPLVAWIMLRWSRRGRTSAHLIRRGLTSAGVLIALGLCFVAATRWPGSPLPYQAGFWLTYLIPWFALGMVLAILESIARHDTVPRWGERLRALGRYPGTCWAVAAGAFLLAATPLGGPRAFEAPTDVVSGIAKVTLYGVSAFFVLLPLIMQAVGTDPLRRALQSRVGRWIGATSYGVFLWHLVIIEAVMLALGIEDFTGGFWPVFAATYAITLVIAWITYRLVERPAMTLARRLSARAAPRR